MVFLKQFNILFSHFPAKPCWQYKTLTCDVKISACCHSYLYFCVTCFFWLRMLRIALLSSSCETEWKKKMYRIFPRAFTHGGICHPPYGRGAQSVNGGPYEGGHRPNFDRLYHKLKVLLMLSCNYTMQFIGYDSIKTRWFISYCFQIRTITQHQYKRVGAIDCIM